MAHEGEPTNRRGVLPQEDQSGNLFTTFAKSTDLAQISAGEGGHRGRQVLRAFKQHFSNKEIPG
jgi:hypothetical protein